MCKTSLCTRRKLRQQCVRQRICMREHVCVICCTHDCVSKFCTQYTHTLSRICMPGMHHAITPEITYRSQNCRPNCIRMRVPRSAFRAPRAACFCFVLVNRKYRLDGAYVIRTVCATHIKYGHGAFGWFNPIHSRWWRGGHVMRILEMLVLAGWLFN